MDAKTRDAIVRLLRHSTEFPIFIDHLKSLREDLRNAYESVDPNDLVSVARFQGKIQQLTIIININEDNIE